MTFFGRYRQFPQDRPATDDQIRDGFNTMIQSTSADLIKICMVMTDAELKKSGKGKQVLTLHDEILFEIKDEDVEEQKQVLADIMSRSAKFKDNWCNFKTSVNSGKNWEEASK